MAGRAHTVYGPKKLDKAAYEAQQKKAKVTIGNVVYGPRKGAPLEEGTPNVVVDGVEYGPETPEAKAAVAAGKAGKGKAGTADDSPFKGMTLEALEKRLGKTPDDLDAAIEYEFRSGNPRKGAVDMFLQLEHSKPEPREKVIALLTGAETDADGGEPGGLPPAEGDTPPAGDEG